MKARRRAKRRRQAAELIRRCCTYTLLVFVSVCIFVTAFLHIQLISFLVSVFFHQANKGLHLPP